MAKLYPNPVAGQLRGTIGNLVFVANKSGPTIVRRRPVRNSPRTAGELRSQQAFKESVAYAKAVWLTRPDLRTKYEIAASRSGRKGFQLAKADFRQPPRVEDILLQRYIGQPGGIIEIRAADDFDVAGVHVAIRRLTGELIEEGAATTVNGGWEYTAQSAVASGQTVVIEATATDHPGHQGSRRIDHACGPRS